MMIRHILQYLIVHPDAKDTLQGMLRGSDKQVMRCPSFLA
jgi:hypothetical protein